jgi:hypothetical protein
MGDPLTRSITPMPMMSLAFLRRPGWPVVCAALWLASVVAGFAGLAAYDNRPGTAATPPGQWPAETALARDPDGPTLVMLTHPRCTCSRASVAELAEIVARARHRPRVYVVFIRPGAFGDGWEKTDLWQNAARIPGAVVVRDDDGVEANRFGAATSGQTMLYDAHGLLLFSGGITGSRGHAGDNPGRAAVLSLLNRAVGRGPATPVFGCPLFSEGDEDHTHADGDRHDH